MKYNFKKIEKKWQKIWARNNYASWHAKDFAPKKKYILDMFPYPSGEGLHVGHVEGYTATDIYSRFLRRNGYNVLHPMGWDAFGLPAENYAIKTKTHPEIVVRRNIKRFKTQLKSLGFSYDWRREISTIDPRYYRWTQWIFLQLFKSGLAYYDKAPINWCPSCKTGLANEEVIGGGCERCGTKVETKVLNQWLLKITSYADRLLEDLETLDWPENVKEMQRNWIGRSEGYEVSFKVLNQNHFIKIFTTRIDTIFGATFLVLAPEHPLALEISDPSQKLKVKDYIENSLNRPPAQRKEVLQKTGIFTGAYAINPATRQKIPIWISDYVLGEYATAAIMGVPAHDRRDFEFAKTFNLPIKQVISPDGKEAKEIFEAYEKEGILINSGPFDRMLSSEAKDKIASYVSAKSQIRYKLRDWIFSRQRYWGEPIPLVYCKACNDRLKEFANLNLQNIRTIKDALNFKLKVGNIIYSFGEIINPGWVAIPENQLPLKLPSVKFYEPTGTGESPLAGISKWVNTKCPRCNAPARRETNTMPQWAGSCWYYIAYAINKNSKFEIRNSKYSKFKIQNSKNSKFEIRNSKLLKYWLPVDLYVGGVEHAVLHLLYARFWHKFLYDIGIVPTKEPFQKLFNQGLILGPDGEKMSKSRGNVINPDDMIKQYGADSLRLYEMFMGPLEQVKPWDPQGIVGMHRFLNRVWNLVIEWLKPKSQKFKITPTASRSATNDIKRLMHKTIKKVTDDILSLRFNTAISALMEFQNALAFQAHLLPKKDLQIAIKTLLSLLAPFAPHITEELWVYICGKSQSINSIHEMPWPKYNPKYLREEMVNYIIQINGKLRDTIKVKAGTSEKEVIDLAIKSSKISKWLEGKKIKKHIFVKDKLLNFVV